MLQAVAYELTRFIDVRLLKKDSGRVAAPVNLLKRSRIHRLGVALGLDFMLTSEYFFLNIRRREDSKHCVSRSDHQGYKIDQPEPLIQSHPEVVISNSKCNNRQFEDLENGPRDDKVHGEGVGRALQQVVLIDPVMNTSDYDDGRHADRVDVRVEEKSEQLNEVEAVSICEVELRQLTNLVVLHLKQRIMVEKTISKLPPIPLNLAVDLEEVQRNRDKS